MTAYDFAAFDVESSLAPDLTIAAYRTARPKRRRRFWRIYR